MQGREAARHFATEALYISARSDGRSSFSGARRGAPRRSTCHGKRRHIYHQSSSGSRTFVGDEKVGGIVLEAPLESARVFSLSREEYRWLGQRYSRWPSVRPRTARSSRNLYCAESNTSIPAAPVAATPKRISSFATRTHSTARSQWRINPPSCVLNSTSGWIRAMDLRMDG